jgi:hypothetical protein
MSSEEKPSAQRRSFRCGVPAGQQEAILEAGGWRYRVRLLNESVEGAAVWADQDMGVKADDEVRLSTAFGRFVARVAHVAEFDPAGAGGSPEKRGFRLGLEWLREPPPPAWQTAAPDTARSPAPSPPGES